MFLVLLPVLGVHFLLRDSRAQSVTQPDAQVTVTEEAFLKLRCNYSSRVVPYLHWYVQYPQQGLQRLLGYYSGDTLVRGMSGFEAEFIKQDSSFHLKKASVHLSDSAVYFCALGAQWVRGFEVEQSPPALSLHEGTSSALTCNFSITVTYMQWFRQNPGGSLVNLFYLTPGTKENGRLKSTFNSKERYSTLYIRDAQLGDSGTYLCAADAQCSQQACSLSPNCSCVCS
ncbi:uncharacterized protein LOC131918993 [Peromyscus eremicus]|uniref:uncharacterized protein LOC131918993 n=1 Tax=Peromyscus eremicus TaxID=42410 RepID=UPI0027DE3177|nr:uncharacterized protein LOC131918993 [Peromyscus eremicus]